MAFQHRTASIGRDARLHWALAQLGSRLVRSRVDNRLEGDGSSVEQVEIVFGSHDQLFDLTSYTRHIGTNATCDLLSKGALLQDASRTFLKGLVTIDKSALGTDSFLGEYGMNLSKKARAVAIPSLEIDQPDCRRVAHSSSVGPIDETQLFYLESRGISPDEARKFIVLGFLEPVVARVPLQAARDRLRGLLEEKWDAAHGGAAKRPAPRDPADRPHRSVDDVRAGTMQHGLGGRHGAGSRGQPRRRAACHAGHLQPRILRAGQGIPDGRLDDVRPAPVTLRPRQRRAPGSAGRGALGVYPVFVEDGRVIVEYPG